MGTIKLDYRQLTAFQSRGNAYLNRVEGFTVLVHAIGQRVMPQVDKAIAKMGEKARLEMEKKEYEYAEKDAKTEVLLKNTDGTYQYTSDNAQKLAEEKSKINFPDGTAEIETHIPKFNHKVLTVYELMAFEGIVIPTMEELYADQLKDAYAQAPATNNVEETVS